MQPHQLYGNTNCNVRNTPVVGWSTGLKKAHIDPLMQRQLRETVLCECARSLRTDHYVTKATKLIPPRWNPHDSLQAPCTLWLISHGEWLGSTTDNKEQEEWICQSNSFHSQVLETYFNAVALEGKQIAKGSESREQQCVELPGISAL
eukprot:2286182-Amphidinium_carterae.2